MLSTLRQFLKELCLFWNLEYRKYTVFRSFLLHALTYWSEIVHMALLRWTTDQVRVSSLKFCTWLCFNVLQIKFECCHFASIFIRPSSDGTYYGMVMSVRPSDSPSARFPHFSHTFFDILSWNFAHDFVLMYYRSNLSVLTLRQFFEGVMPLCELRI